MSPNKIVLLIFITLSFSACSVEKDLFINYSHPNVTYSGRVDTFHEKTTELHWSGTSVKMNFEGEEVAAMLKDENGDNYYNVILDDDSIVMLRVDKAKRYHQLASGLSKGKHSIEIFKRTEWAQGKTSFYGFQIKGNPKILAPPPKRKRKMEFYGNSITAGYAVEDFSGEDSPDSSFTNNYLSYAAITSRHFNAEYSCICKSGIGVMVSWFPMIMPEMYNRLTPNDPGSKWDFSRYTPDVIVVNLFQNDSWLVNRPDHEQFVKRFGTKAPDDNFIIQSYVQFISSIRKEYPDAEIICLLGNMDATRKGSKWPGIVDTAVRQLNDSKIYSHSIPFKNSKGHPSIQEQEDIANSLIQFIDENIEW